MDLSRYGEPWTASDERPAASERGEHFIQDLHVVFTDEDVGLFIRAVRGRGMDRAENVNQGYGGKYVYLIPVYTSDPAAAASGWQLTVQSTPQFGRSNLAESAGGYWRYLDRLPLAIPPSPPAAGDPAPAPVRQVRLIRGRQSLEQAIRNDGWISGYSGDLNVGRSRAEGEELYVVWGSRGAGEVRAVGSSLPESGDERLGPIGL